LSRGGIRAVIIYAHFRQLLRVFRPEQHRQFVWVFADVIAEAATSQSWTAFGAALDSAYATFSAA